MGTVEYLHGDYKISQGFQYKLRQTPHIFVIAVPWLTTTVPLYPPDIVHPSRGPGGKVRCDLIGE